MNRESIVSSRRLTSPSASIICVGQPCSKSSADFPDVVASTRLEPLPFLCGNHAKWLRAGSTGRDISPKVGPACALLPFTFVHALTRRSGVLEQQARRTIRQLADQHCGAPSSEFPDVTLRRREASASRRLQFDMTQHIRSEEWCGFCGLDQRRQPFTLRDGPDPSTVGRRPI